MKKVIISVISLLTFAACQNSPDLVKNSADQDKSERAASLSKVSLEVKDPVGKPSVVPDMKAFVITANGLTPGSLELSKGMTLMIYNDLDQQADLYTTLDGDTACPQIGATLKLQAKETKNIKVDQAMECTIINQFNTDQKVLISVK